MKRRSIGLWLSAALGVLSPVAAASAQPAASDQPGLVVFTGEEARRSEHAQAAVRLVRLVHSSSFEEVLRQVAPGNKALENLSADNQAMLLGLMRELMPTAEVFAATIDRVEIRGEAARVSAPSQGGTSTVSIRRHQGRWMLAPTDD